jgi:hypothetical protein
MATFLILNFVIILNLVIAILSDTFATYSAYKRGLYYDSQIMTIPKLKYHELYGAMTCALGPFASLQFALNPIYLFLQG